MLGSGTGVLSNLALHLLHLTFACSVGLSAGYPTGYLVELEVFLEARPCSGFTRKPSKIYICFALLFSLILNFLQLDNFLHHPKVHLLSLLFFVDQLTKHLVQISLDSIAL